jgi:hypothetical protein
VRRESLGGLAEGVPATLLTEMKPSDKMKKGSIRE